jgi:hypothetical protein
LQYTLKVKISDNNFVIEAAIAILETVSLVFICRTNGADPTVKNFAAVPYIPAHTKVSSSIIIFQLVVFGRSLELSG